MKGNRSTALLVALAAALLAQSCASGPRLPQRDGITVAKAHYGSPENSVLVYGSTLIPKGVKFYKDARPLYADFQLADMVMIQLNPSLEPAIITPGRIGPKGQAYFYTEPLPAGSSIRILNFYSIIPRETFYLRGVQGSGPTDVTLANPGLYFMGSLDYCDGEYIESHAPQFKGRGWDDWDFYPVGDMKEIDILKALLPQFAETEWESIIQARIKELER